MNRARDKKEKIKWYGWLGAILLSPIWLLAVVLGVLGFLTLVTISALIKAVESPEARR